MKTDTKTVQSFQLYQVIHESINRCRPLAQEYKAEIEVNDDIASFITVKADLGDQKKLLEIVLLNTIRYSKPSRVCINVKQILLTGKELVVEYTLVDNGTMPKLCAASFGYFRTLVHIQNMVEAMKGKIEYVVAPGLPTTLKILLHYQWEPVSVLPMQTGQPNLVSSKRILVAEDNEVNQKLIETMLVKNGIRADWVGNGKQAIDQLEKEDSSFDMVLLDLDMPHMDGYQVAHYIRKKISGDLPILALSAGGEDCMEKCMAYGINNLVKKPFTEKELVDSIEQLTASICREAC